ncbi:ubiquitin carboxyl-terminal hydrolase 45 isoform X3 [Apis mellifera]|nr:ubiquitin carboxyl-terminal hydrolase 45 isoform X3 [Apis mellifera]|eukprot:XP_026296412.1 ubiquitin carboxyl-terminal hydrolase 45 isoform X3 [Apis mellifera]
MNSAILICLQCGHQGCGREECGHALEHYKKPHSDCHVMVVESLYWSVWCFQCETKVNIGCRKKLQETVEFIKRSTTSITSSQTKMSVSQYQKETRTDADKLEKEKNLYNLPKVGGLMNLGNTCFFNAVLQCLAQTPFLVKVLDDLRLPGQKFILPGGKHKFSNNSEEVDLPPIEGTLEGWGSFTSILCKTLTEMQNTDGRQSYRPSELLNSFKKKTMQCMDGGQHDSHELLRHLLEIVRNEDLRRYQSIILKEVGLNEKTNPEGVEESLKSRVKFYGNQANSRLLGAELVFRGVLVSTLECLDCHHTSQNTEPFLDLSLPVMADKPQPPVLKRKNNGFEDTFDIMGNNISHVPSKHQLKKEKKAARKNRKSKKQEIRQDDNFISNKNNIAEENNLKSEESDADVEDNAEIEGLLPEVGESGYSSEKQSTLASPASPSTDTMKTNETISEVPLDNYLQLSTKDNISLVQLLNRFDTNSLPSPNSANACTTNLSQTKGLDTLDSSESFENESGIQTGFSLSTSLAMTSDLTSPDVPSINFNSVISKENSSSTIILANDKSIENTKLSTFSLDLTESVNHIDQEESTCNQWKTRRKIEDYSNDISNGINNITSGISKIGIGDSLQQPPTRYLTKEGECSIQSCLNQFTALELMSGSNKVSCEACTANEKKVKQNCKMVCTPSTKQYLISRVPAVLILHLKRFQAQRVDFRKVTRHVSFPILLDLAPICKNHKKARIYALYGVVEHSGTIHGGHYVAYIKSRLPLTSDDPRWSFLPSKDIKNTQENSYSSSSESETEEAAASPSSTVEPPPGKWYHVSDSRVTEVDETTVLQRQAYLLFYERIL